MIFGIVFIITFILGFAFGLAMPFILLKYPFKIRDNKIETNDPQSNVNVLLDEWVNGKGVDN